MPSQRPLSSLNLNSGLPSNSDNMNWISCTAAPCRLPLYRSVWYEDGRSDGASQTDRVKPSVMPSIAPLSTESALYWLMTAAPS